MRQAIEAAGPVLIAALLLVFGNGLLGTLTSLRLTSDTGAAWLAGIATSAYFGGQLLGAIYGQRTLRTVGHVRTFAAFAAIAASVALLQPMLGLGWAWIALRFVFGFGVVVMILTMESWLNASVRNEARGSVFGVYMIAVYGGLALGQAPVAFMDLSSPIGFSIAAICIMLATLPMSLTARAQPAIDDEKPLSIWRIFAASPTGAVSAVASGALIGCGIGLGPVYANAVGLTDSGVAAFIVTFLVAGLIASYPLGRLSDRIDRRIVILAISFALAGAGAAGALAAAQSPVLAFGLAAIFGLCALPLYSLAVAHANDVMEGESPVATAGGMIVGFGVGAMAAPGAVSIVMDATSAAAFPAIMGAIALATAIVVLARMSANPAKARGDKTPYQPLPGTTSVVYELDPWAAAEEEDSTESVSALKAAASSTGETVGETVGKTLGDSVDETASVGWSDAWFSPNDDEPLDTAAETKGANFVKPD